MELVIKKTIDVDVAKFINNDLIVYDALTKKNVKSLRSLRSNKERHYSFDINQTDVIFLLIFNKQKD